MLIRGIVFAALLLALAPPRVVAQWREPGLPRSMPLALAPESSREPSRALSGERAAGPVRHAFLGALVGAAAGFGVYLIHEKTTRHTDHSYDPVVRFSAVTAGAALGAVAGVAVYAVRNR